MTARRSGTTSRDMRHQNRLLVRDIIRLKGPISRNEIARVTGLTPPTITNVVNELLASNMVREIGPGESTGGRRPVLLELNPNAGFVFAARIQRGEIVTALLDLVGTVLASSRTSLDNTDPDTFIQAIAGAFEMLAAGAGVARHQALWCGVAPPRLVDPERGVVHRSSNLAWSQVALGPMLSDAIGGIPVHVENVSKAAALGEKAYGSGQGYQNLVYLNLSVGISAGIIVDNQVFSGSRGYAGEIGHVATVANGGPLCACGQYGCLEATCGLKALLKKVADETPAEALKALGIDAAQLSVEHLTGELAQVPQVRRIIQEAGKTIGLFISTVMTLFDPEIVILGGELARLDETFLDAVVRSARKHGLADIVQNIPIVRSTMRDDPGLMGAYALALDEVFALEDWHRAE